MLKILSIPMTLAACVFLASCASERTVTYEKAKGEGLRKFESDVEFKTGKDGQAEWTNAKRSSFESQSGYGATKDFKGKSFDKSEFSKKGWSANKKYASKQYKGHKDGSGFQKSPHFAQKQSRAQGNYSDHASKKFGTSDYTAANVKANRGRDFKKFEDTETNIRRRVYKEPTIQSYQEYNGLSLSESKYLMGR